FAAQGGAIDNESGSTLTLVGSTFAGNQALAHATFSAGGALESFSATLHLHASVFTHNQSIGLVGSDGGAIDDTFGPAGIAGTTFSQNASLGSGPGACTEGGAIGNFVASMTLTDCSFLANVSRASDGANGVTTFGQSLGGAVLNFSGTMIMTGCTVLDNLS